MGVEPSVLVSSSALKKHASLWVMQWSNGYFFDHYEYYCYYFDIVLKWQQVYWPRLRLLPLHVKRRTRLFHRHQPTNAPRLRVVSIPPVATKNLRNCSQNVEGGSIRM